MRARITPTEDKLIIVGLCAGAYHGLKAAIAGAHVDAIVLINPLTFDWKCGDSLKSGFNDNEVVCAMSNYRRSIFSARLWQRLRDRSFSVRHALGRMRRFAALILRSKLCDISSLVGLPLPGHLGHELEQLGRRKVSLHFVFAAGEPGAKLLEIHAGHSVTRLERRGLLSRIELHDADHIFTTLDSRRRLIDTLDGLTARIQAQRMEHCLRVGHGHRC